MEIQYGREYRNLYEHHWWWRAREEAIVGLLRSEKLAPSVNILDVGCGDGLFFNRLAEFGTVEGLEADERLLDPANPHRAKIYTVPFDKNFQPGKRYGLILMLDVLEHLDNPGEALECVHDLLEENGIFVLTVPAFQLFWTNHDVINHHRIRYKKETLFPLLRTAKFEIKKSQYWFQWTAPVKFAERLVEKIISSQPALPNIPPKPVNNFLFHFSQLEQRTVSKLGIPFGTTLMALCTKKNGTTSGK